MCTARNTVYTHWRGRVGLQVRTARNNHPRCQHYEMCTARNTGYTHLRGRVASPRTVRNNHRRCQHHTEMCTARNTGYTHRRGRFASSPALPEIIIVDVNIILICALREILYSRESRCQHFEVCTARNVSFGVLHSKKETLGDVSIQRSAAEKET
jgi:hypothetical protein